RFDYRQRDSVLYRATGILILEFEKKLTRSGVELRYFNQRRVADERQDAGRFLGRNCGGDGRFGHDGLVVILPISVRLCATILIGCLQEIVGARGIGLRRNSMRNGDRRFCKSKSSGSMIAPDRQIV